MNFTHQVSCSLSKCAGGDYKLYRITFPQVKVQDPNIGCGHYVKLINEWQLRKALYKHCHKRGKKLSDEEN